MVVILGVNWPLRSYTRNIGAAGPDVKAAAAGQRSSDTSGRDGYDDCDRRTRRLPGENAGVDCTSPSGVVGLSMSTFCLCGGIGREPTQFQQQVTQ